MTTPYQEGYEQGEWDTENRLCDDLAVTLATFGIGGTDV